jgi:hypothetical protein
LRSLILAAALAAIAAPAFAASTWSATLAQPTSKQVFVGETVIWSCDATGCVSQSDTSDADQVSECRALARRLGEISAFNGHSGALPAERLASCNTSAAKPKH